MTAQELKSHDTVAFDDLKALASATGPCISIVISIANPQELSTRLNHVSRAIRMELAEQGADAKAIASLMKPVDDLIVTAEGDGVWGNALILYRSSDVFRYYWVHESRKELTLVAAHFQMRPLLSILRRDQQCYLLALSKRQVRLFLCTQQKAVELHLPESVPESLTAWIDVRQPSGTGPGADREAEYFRHFLKSVDEGIHPLLRDATEALILAGVEYEVAIYREVNTYPHLSKQTVFGSPDGRPPAELYEQAREIMLQSFSEPLQEALSTLEKHRDRGHVTQDAYEAVKAACQGRTADLFIAEDAEMRGVWREDTQTIEERTEGAEQQDLLNEAALQTILHGGRAFVLNPSDMPAPTQAAAVLRF